MKKQIAVLMAAATAVTTVAPALANAESVDKGKVDVKTVVETVEKALTDYPKDFTGIKKWSKSNKLVLLYVGDNKANLLNKDGFEEFTNGKYTNKNYVLPKVDGKTTTQDNWVIVTDANALNNYLVNSVSDSNFKSATVAIINRNLESNGADERESEYKYLVVDNANNNSQTLSDLAKALLELSKAETNKFVDSVKVNGEKITNEAGAANAKEVKVKFVGGEEKTYSEYDAVPDTKKPVDKAGNEILTNSGTLSDSILKTIVNFKSVEADKTVEVPVRTGNADVYTVVVDDASTMLIKNFYSKDEGYNKKDADFINSLIAADEQKDGAKPTFNFGGKTYTVNKDTIKNAVSDAEIKLVDGVYTATFTFLANEYNNPMVTNKLAIKLEDKNLYAVQSVLKSLREHKNIVTGSFTRLVGTDRYKTAIEVSKEQFEDKKADTIVIVGGEAIYDGLTAAPFAATKNAPILLANPKTGLDEATLSEIGRVGKNLNSKTVYIVGGVNSVPTSVEKQLAEKFGAVVRRFAGSTRVGTSNRVAEQILNNGNSNGRIFFVGHNGQADAMSISAVAANSKNVRNINVNDNLVKAASSKNAAETAYDGAITGKAVEAKAYFDAVDTKKKADDAYKKLISDNKAVLDTLNQGEELSAILDKIYKKDVTKDTDVTLNVLSKAEVDRINASKATLKPEASNIVDDAMQKLQAYKTSQKDVEVKKDALGFDDSKLENVTKLKKSFDDANIAYQAALNAVNNGSSSVTSKLVSPIMILDGNNVDQYTRELVARFNITSGYVVGGLNTVSAGAFRAINTKLDGTSYGLTRLFGSDRYETNLSIVKEFYGKTDDNNKIAIKGAVFASGNDKYLVDAQTAGAFAGSNHYPIILTSEKLTNNQSTVLLKKDKGLLSGLGKSESIFQVGGVVSSDVMKQVVESLGL